MRPVTLTEQARPLRILIVRVGAMGDVLHGMPAAAALRAACPEAFLGWAVEPRWSPLLSADRGASARGPAQPLVDRVHPVETKAWSRKPFSLATLRSIRDLRRALRAERYDIAIDLQGSVRSAVIARLSGAPRVLGSEAPREWPARFLYTERVRVSSAHVIHHAAEIASAAIHTTLHPQPAPLPVDPVAERWCDALLERDERPLVFLAPTAGWGAKQWPLQKFAACALAMSQAGLRVLVNQAGPQDATAAALLRSTGGLAEAAECSIAQMIALLRRVSLVVAGDTGPLHLAAALHRPVVALFGPTDPVRNGPFGARSVVLRSASSVTDHRRHAETEVGLASIPVEDVLEAAAGLLDRPIPHPGTMQRSAPTGPIR